MINRDDIKNKELKEEQLKYASGASDPEAEILKVPKIKIAEIPDYVLGNNVNCPGPEDRRPRADLPQAGKDFVVLPGEKSIS